MARLKKGLTQEDLGKRIGRNKQYVSSIERGRHNPGARLYPTIADVLGIPVEELINYYEGIDLSVGSSI